MDYIKLKKMSMAIDEIASELYGALDESKVEVEKNPAEQTMRKELYDAAFELSKAYGVLEFVITRYKIRHNLKQNLIELDMDDIPFGRSLSNCIEQYSRSKRIATLKEMRFDYA